MIRNVLSHLKEVQGKLIQWLKNSSNTQIFTWSFSACWLLSSWLALITTRWLPQLQASHPHAEAEKEEFLLTCISFNKKGKLFQKSPSRLPLKSHWPELYLKMPKLITWRRNLSLWLTLINHKSPLRAKTGLCPGHRLQILLSERKQKSRRREEGRGQEEKNKTKLGCWGERCAISGLNIRASFLPGGIRKIFPEQRKQMLKAEEESTTNTGPTLCLHTEEPFQLNTDPLPRQASAKNNVCLLSQRGSRCCQPRRGYSPTEVPKPRLRPHLKSVHRRRV